MRIFLLVVCLCLASAEKKGDKKTTSTKKPDKHPEHPPRRKLVIDPHTKQLYYTGHGPNEPNCDKNCKDKHDLLCKLPGISQKCYGGGFSVLLALKCPMTCKICKPCDYSAGVCSKECNDVKPQKCKLFAPAYCTHYTWGNTVKKVCPKSCGICVACSDLTPVPECSNDCVDDDPRQCPMWAKAPNFFCKRESRYSQWMNNRCRRSCGVCRHCDGEAPPGYTTRRPPTTRRPYYTSRRPYYTTRRPYYTTRRPYYTTRRPYSTRSPHTTRPDFACRRQKGGSFEDRCLDTHNYFRCLHGVAPVEYSRTLEISASDYAKYLGSEGIVEPSRPGGKFRDRDEGESVSLVPRESYAIEDAVAMWYAEGLGYDFVMAPINPDTERFTQLIWADTAKIGCALRQFDSQSDIVVIHYSPAGNDPDKSLSNIFEPILDVCLADCDKGYCQGHDNTHDCRCKTVWRPNDTPTCKGHCVVRCPEPRDYKGHEPWLESCEGRYACTCTRSGAKCD